MPVTSVTELINLLAARRQASILHDRRTGMPYSWSHWVRTRASRALSAFAVADVATVIAARPEPPRMPVPASRPFWRTMLLLLWQGSDPPERDQRPLRWFAGCVSVVLHLLFALLLVWVALVRSTTPDDAAQAGERVRVEYIGRGTPEEQGGGAPQAGGQAPAAAEGAATQAAAAAATAAAAASASAPAAEAAPAAAEMASSMDAADGEADAMPVDASKPSPQPSATQPLQVTQTPQPASEFVLPPPTLRPPTVAVPAVEVPQVQVRERVVETATERPQVTPTVRAPALLQPQLAMPETQVRERQVEVAPQQAVTMAQLRTREAEVRVAQGDIVVRERQVEVAPRQSVTMAAVRSNEAPGPALKAPTVAVRERQIPAAADPVAAPAAAAGGAAAPAGNNKPRTQASAAGSAAAERAPRPGSGNAGPPASQAGTSQGAGPKPQDRSGGWDAPVRGDDWGAAQRQAAGTAGGQADNGRGLFNADGSVRLGSNDRDGRDDARGAPGGDADSWTRDRIAQSGTWLKRPPYEHTPTSFDKYWVPNESLLAEWVRKGIKSIEIPIPGTGNKISCVVSMLQFGGGCGLTNSNMQEQPAEARPPPDIPFKKELQEDNGSR